MTKNEMTAAMFEEIKETLTSMNMKLDTITSDNDKIRDIILDDDERRKSKTIKIEYVIKFLLDSIDGILTASSDKLLVKNEQVISKIDKHTSTTESALSDIGKGLKKKKLQRLIVMVFHVLFVLVAAFNFYLFNENQRLMDCDLQLNYLKVSGELDINTLNHLDTIFNIHRDENVIEYVRQAVYDE